MNPERWRRLQQLFDSAVELPPQSRLEYLEEACGTDHTLRRQLESLIVASEEGEGQVQAALEEAARDLPAPSSAPGEGERVGPYRLLEVLGEGGMGTVYLAERDDQEYRQRVALKLVRDRLGRRGGAERFRRERQILANLQHPNIARLLDGGTTPSGLPYLVMEYVDGVPLDRYCDARRLGIEARLCLFRTVCDAVRFAHRNLVVHRDLKPSNILVTEAGQPKLLDFGVAKLLRDEPMSADAQTETGTRVFTLAYASPEQIVGGAITTASDVYALGLLLYELLTGHRPQSGIPSAPADLLRTICETVPEPPSGAVFRLAGSRSSPDGEGTLVLTPMEIGRARQMRPDKLSRALQGDLDTIVMTALRKEPERRYPSVEQLAADVGHYLAGRPVLARADSVGYRAQKFVKRHRVGVVMAAGVLVLLLAVAVAMTAQAARIARERDRANREADTAEQVTEFLVDLFETSNPFVVSDASPAHGEKVTVKEVLDRGAERIATELEDRPEVRSRLMEAIGRVYRALALYDRAEPLLEGSLELRRRSLGEEHPAVAESLFTLGELHFDLGEYEQAEALMRAALERRLELYGDEHPDVAQALNTLGRVLTDRGQLDAAEELYRRALGLRLRLHGPGHHNVATVRHNLAEVLREKGQDAEAEKLLRQVVATDRRLLGPEHAFLAASLNSLALVVGDRGDYEEAERLHLEALDVRRRTLGEHPLIATDLQNLAWVKQQQGEVEAGERLLREAVELRRRLLGEEHPELVETRHNLASLLHHRGDLEEAESLFRQAIPGYERALGPGHWKVAAARSNYGDCLTALGRYREAERELQAALAGLLETLGEEHPRTASTREKLAHLYRVWGKPELAERYPNGSSG